MEINIFPFVCKIYIVRCKFCNRYRGHLIVSADVNSEDPDHFVRERFSWCSVECEPETKKANEAYESTVTLELMTRQANDQT